MFSEAAKGGTLPEELQELVAHDTLARRYGKLPSELADTATLFDLNCLNAGVTLENERHIASRYT